MSNPLDNYILNLDQQKAGTIDLSCRFSDLSTLLKLQPSFRGS